MLLAARPPGRKSFFENERETMMKKIVTLVLVLSMVSVASATLTLTAPDIVGAGGSTVVTLSGHEDDEFGGYLWVNYYTWSSPYQWSNWAWGPVITTNSYSILDGTGYESNTNGLKIVAVEHSTTSTDTRTGVWLTLDLAAKPGDALGTIYSISLTDNNFQAVGNSIDVEIVPEPATMALLGLGGLLLRRKNKH